MRVEGSEAYASALVIEPVKVLPWEMISSSLTFLEVTKLIISVGLAFRRLI